MANARHLPQFTEFRRVLRSYRRQLVMYLMPRQLAFNTEMRAQRKVSWIIETSCLDENPLPAEVLHPKT